MRAVMGEEKRSVGRAFPRSGEEEKSSRAEWSRGEERNQAEWR
jgi:hypothetical protein